MKRTFFLLIAVFFWFQAGEGLAAEMVSHKAFYSMKLGNVRQGSDFVGVRGKMGLSMERTCDGWTMSQNMRMDLSTPEGNEVLQDLRFTGWESTDGRRYRFFASNTVNGEREDFRGRVLKPTATGPGNAIFRIPEGRKIPLPEGTLFPIGHTAWLIDKARAGERQLSTPVFDGADGEAPQQVSAFIGAKFKPGQQVPMEKLKALGPLAQAAGWKIRMGFYELDSHASAPDYEIEILQLENGVTSSMLLEYPDFSVVLTLEQLEEIPSPDCG